MPGTKSGRDAAQQCQENAHPWDDLLGSRALLAKLEARAPLLAPFSRTSRYGPVPAELFAFTDVGLTWSRSDTGPFSAERVTFRSVGAGVRVNALLGALEIAAARPLDGPYQRWRIVLNMRPGF